MDELQSAIIDEPAPPQAPSRMRKDEPWAARAAVALAMAVAVVFAAAFILYGRATPRPALNAPPSAAEFSAFHMAESINTADAWSTFLSNYHRGELANVARDRLEKLKAQAAAAVKTDVAVTVAKPADVLPAPNAPVPSPKWSAFAEMVQVQGGDFKMGNDNGKKDEKPQHQVRVDAFRISRSEITNRQYLTFLDDTGYPRPKDSKNNLTAYPDLPVVNVSYDDAAAFCKWVGSKFAVPVRLPTEAEWEYASQNHVPRATHPTAWEWVADFYSKDYYPVSPDKNPAGPVTGTGASSAAKASPARPGIPKTAPTSSASGSSSPPAPCIKREVLIRGRVA